MLSPPDARRHATVARRALTEAQERRNRRAANLRARGCSQALIRRVLAPADDNIRTLERMLRGDRLHLVRTCRPRRATCMHRHRRAPARRASRRRGSRRCGARGDPDDDGGDPAPLALALSATRPHLITREARRD
jgi:hypothetical protein